MTITTIIALSGAAVGAITGVGALINSLSSAKTASASAQATATKLIEEVYGDIIDKLRARVEELEKTIKSLTDHSCDNYDCEFRNKKRP